jgi:transposase
MFLFHSGEVSDTVPTVVHPVVRKGPKNLPQPAVNNCAAPKMNASEKVLCPRHPSTGRIALDGSRSEVSHPTRIKTGLSVRPAAPFATSERIKAHEAPGIGSTHEGATMHNRKGPHMKDWKDITHYLGFDWAKDHHMAVIVDGQGQIVADFEFEHSLEGWKIFSEKTAPWPNLAVAIETNQGAAVDQLLQRGYTVYPINPVASESYRKRKAPSGTKTDHLDGWSLADALRVEGMGWKPLKPMDPLTQKLRLLCQDEVSLIEQRTLLVNKLQQALLEYYPIALQAFDDWTASFTWDFVIEFPTPQQLVKAGKRRWEKFLHTHKLWRPETTERRLALFAQADQFKASDCILEAKSQLALSLCKLLRTLDQQLEQYRQQIEKLFKDHPDHDLFGSLPGAKKVLGPRLLAAIGGDPDRYGDQKVLQCYAGTAPVNYQSGRVHKTKIRWACDKFMRHTVHLWANCFRQSSAWGQTYYQKKRKEGMSHACALRCLGQRLLKILFRMITDRKPYDAEYHALNQKKHGSWVLSLVEKPTPKPCE